MPTHLEFKCNAVLLKMSVFGDIKMTPIEYSLIFMRREFLINAEMTARPNY